MKKIARTWGNIPRRIRAGINVAMILILLLVFYISIGAPSLTLERRFRQLQKAYLVGPGEIVDHIEWGLYPEFTDLLVAHTRDGVMFYGYWDQNHPLEDYETFSYREKTGDMTFLAPPSMLFSWVWNNFERTLPLYLFDDCPEAVRAEVQIRVLGNAQVDNDRYMDLDVTFELTGDRYGDGVFRFLLELGMGSSYMDLAAAQMLTEISTTADSWPYAYTRAFQREPHAEITVKLYDERDNLIAQEDLVLRTVSGEAQAKRGELD